MKDLSEIMKEWNKYIQDNSDNWEEEKPKKNNDDMEKRFFRYSQELAWIPKRYKDIFVSQEFKQNKSILSQCKVYVEKFNNKSPNILLLGNKGQGKTFTACAVLNELIKKGYDCMIIQLNTYFDMKKRSFNGETEDPTDRLCEVDCLVLDEVGSYALSEADFKYLFDVINARYEDEKPTILISNVLNPKGFIKLLRPAVADRILEKCMVIKFKGSSLRTGYNYDE